MARKSNRGIRVTAPLIANLGTGGKLMATSWPLYPRERAPVSIEYEAGWTLEPIQTGFEPRIVHSIV